MDPLDPKVQEVVKRVQMKWETIQVGMGIAPAVFAQDLDVRESYADQITRSLVLKVEAVVLGLERPPKVVSVKEPVFFEYPASPFQHWKYKHRDTWWLKWFILWKPVIIAQKVRTACLTTSWTMRDVYPEQTVATPILGQAYVLIDVPESKFWTEDD